MRKIITQLESIRNELDTAIQQNIDSEQNIWYVDLCCRIDAIINLLREVESEQRISQISEKGSRDSNRTYL